jgi:hypothetical protein
VYEDQGRYDEAEHLHLRTLEASERALGAEHQNTLLSVHNLAILYEGQGRYLGGGRSSPARARS